MRTLDFASGVRFLPPRAYNESKGSPRAPPPPGHGLLIGDMLVRLGQLGTSATIRLILPVPDYDECGAVGGVIGKGN
jgi:hypothetical protein